MLRLECDRPPFARLKDDNVAAARKAYGCPVSARERGEIFCITPRPCEYVRAQPFDDFVSVAARTGRDASYLAAFNGGVVYPCRIIYLYPEGYEPPSL